MRRNYDASIEITDPTPGWRLGARILPTRYVVHLHKPVLIDSRTGRVVRNLTPEEIPVLGSGGKPPKNTLVSVTRWLDVEIESGPETPPRCVALRSQHGITTEMQRFPLAGLITDASASIASRTGSFPDGPQGIEFEDARFEVNRARGRRRSRTPITAERLEDVAQVARRHPRTPTAAVQHHYGVSRGYARRLIKQAEAAGLEIVGTG